MKITNRRDGKLRLKKGFLENNLLILMLACIFVVVIIIEPRFLSIKNIMNILEQSSTKGIMALGMACIILLGFIDLSAGRVLGLCAAVSASLLQSVTYSQRYYQQITTPLPLIVPLLLCIAVSCIIGFINGFAVSRLKIPAFIATLATQLTAYGLLCIYIEAQPSGSAQPLSTLDARYTGLVNATINIGDVHIPWLVIIFLALAVVISLIWNRTVIGKNLFAVGCNSDAAAVSGVNVRKTIMIGYLMGSALIAISAFLEAARVQTVSTLTGNGYELDAISACVIGGISLNGGVGKISGIVLGMIVLQSINYILYYLGVNAYLQYIIRGAIIFAAVAMDIRKTLTKN